MDATGAGSSSKLSRSSGDAAGAAVPPGAAAGPAERPSRSSPKEAWADGVVVVSSSSSRLRRSFTTLPFVGACKGSIKAFRCQNEFSF